MQCDGALQLQHVRNQGSVVIDNGLVQYMSDK